MIQWYDDADAEVELPLACDPDVQAANDPTAVARYVIEGDPSSLVVPDAATRVVVRPLSDRELHAAGQEAGNASSLGAIVSADADEAADKARADAWIEGEHGLGREDRKALNDWRDTGCPPGHAGSSVAAALGERAGEAATMARARFLETLPPEDRAAVAAFVEWQRRREACIIKRGWVRWVGYDVPQAELPGMLDRVRPLSVQRSMRSEISQHIQRLSVLPPLGKAQSNSPSSEETQTPCTSGPAKTAGRVDSGASEATAAS